MIVNNAPAFGQVFEDECEPSVRLVVCPFQPPPTEHHCCIKRKHRDLNVKEIKRSHLRSIGVFHPVSVTDCFPTPTHFIL